MSLFCSEGKTSIEKAVEYDNQKNIILAKDWYLRGVKSYLTSINNKTDLNKDIKELVLNKLNGYMNRIEEIQNELKNKIVKKHEETKVLLNDSSQTNKHKSSNSITDSEEELLIKEIETNILVSENKTTFADIQGLETAKALLKEAVIDQFKYKQFFPDPEYKWKGILLYGTVGSGKTELARAVANESNAAFYNISPAVVTSKWQGLYLNIYTHTSNYTQLSNFLYIIIIIIIIYLLI